MGAAQRLDREPGDVNRLTLGLGLFRSGGGAPVDNLTAVTFDGTNDHLQRAAALTGVTDGTAFSIYWKGATSTAATQTLVAIGANRTRMDITSTGAFNVLVFNTAGSLIANILSNTGWADGAEHTVHFSGTAGGSSALYIDGTSRLASGSIASGTPDMTGGNSVGANTGSANLFNGTMRRVAMWTDVALDVSSASVRTQMADEAQAATLGTNAVDFYGEAAVWNAGTNQGSGGDYTMNGAVV